MARGQGEASNHIEINHLFDIQAVRTESRTGDAVLDRDPSPFSPAPDLLLTLFLAGLLLASASFLGIARATSTSGAPDLATAAGACSDDLLDEYRQACAHGGRRPLLYYAYLVSLSVGLGALLLALL